MSTDQFIARAREIHGDTYTYEDTVYTKANNTLSVRCREHGVFTPYPTNFLRGSGCTTCGKLKSHETQRHTTERFVERSQRLHAGKYTYEKTRYLSAKTKVTITCPKHGDFNVAPFAHLRGTGCSQCGWDKAALARSLSYEEFLEKAKEAHGDGTYDYTGSVYVNSGVKLDIRCPDHGIFSQTPENHLYLEAGCPSCSFRYSKPHKEIEDFLTSNGISYISQDRKFLAPYEIDILLPELHLGIEYNGDYWHSLTGKESTSARFKHKKKFLAAKEAGITLLQISGYEWDHPVTREVWKSILLSKTQLQPKIPGRKTLFEAVPREEADRFLAENHLQGKTPGARWCFGLRYEEDLVGVITFAEHEGTQVNLTRLAFKRNLTIVGGARKLFSNALPLLPQRDVITFSNNQYSRGDVYAHLGFSPDAPLPPSYQWLFKNRIYNKRQCRHKHLPKLLGDAYDPNQTEHENMYRAGARCLYDAGYQRWIFHRTPDASTTAPLSVRSDASLVPQEVHGRRKRGPVEAYGVPGCGQGIQPPDVVQGHRA